MPEMRLKQPALTYSALGSFTKNKEKIKKFKGTGHSRYIYQNETDKACFQHHIAYGKFKKLPRKAVSNKVLRDKTFHIAKNPKYNGYICGPASMVISLLLTKEQELIPI